MRELIMLAAAMFVSMTIEFLPGGLLPGIVADFDVDVSAAGQLVTVFALTVVLTAAPLAQATRRLPRKRLLLVALGVIAAAGMLAAAAPSFAWLVAARVLAGLAHAVFWSVAGAYAAYLVPSSQVARATAWRPGRGHRRRANRQRDGPGLRIAGRFLAVARGGVRCAAASRLVPTPREPGAEGGARRPADGEQGAASGVAGVRAAAGGGPGALIVWPLHRPQPAAGRPRLVVAAGCGPLRRSAYSRRSCRPPRSPSGLGEGPWRAASWWGWRHSLRFPGSLWRATVRRWSPSPWGC